MNSTDLYRDGWERIFGKTPAVDESNCEACPPESPQKATLSYQYSKAIQREDRGRPIRPSVICGMHGAKFKRFAGSVTTLTKETTL